jgi:prolyl 4-hydroxylase
MNIETLLQKAFDHFQNNEIDEGTRLLERAAQTGDPRAVLYYADNLYSIDQESALLFLQQKSIDGIVGAGHRYALLKVFFETRVLEQDIFDALYRDASKGHIESLLILINTISDETISSSLLYKLNDIAPELMQDLDIGLPEQETAFNIKLASELFFENLNNSIIPEPKILQIEIGLTIWKHALSPLECNYFKLRFASMLQPSQIFDPLTGVARQDPIRQSYIATIQPEYLDWFSLDIDRRIAIFSDTQVANGEQINILYYQKGQSYKPHYDALVGEHIGIKAHLKDGGQRIKTVLCYLNDVLEGGETSFPRIPFNYKPCKCDMLLFDNTDNKGSVLNLSYHTGKPVILGDKWVLSKWIRANTTSYGKIVYSKLR